MTYVVHDLRIHFITIFALLLQGFRMKKYFALLLLLSCSLIVFRCTNRSNLPVNVDISGAMVQTLSEYHFFKGNMAELLPNDGVVPYDLNTPLFSDYAEKARFVWMPEGTSAKYNDSLAFDFPVGTVLIKNFYYHNDFTDHSKGRRIMETRLLVHTEKGWEGRPYIWNDEQTDATLEVAGGRKDISWIHSDGQKRELNYVVPNKNQCKGCHEYGGKMTPIGPKAKNLNKDFSYGDKTENQLLHWASAGYLDFKGTPESQPKLAVWNDEKTGTLDQRARAWLDINCAHCHNAKGPANTSGLLLTAEESNLTAIGFCKTPVAAGRGAGEFRYDIVPGNPNESILVYRVASTEPDVMMPELGRKMVHHEGLNLLREWIAAMDTINTCH